MAFRCVLLLALAATPIADAAGLRPYAARHQAQAAPQHHQAAALPAPKVAAPVSVVVELPPPPLPDQSPMHAVASDTDAAAEAIDEPVAAAEPVEEPVSVAVPVEPAAAVEPAEQGSILAVKQLNGDLAEMKQLHGNVVQLEKTLAADVSLLRESAVMQRVSTSTKSRRSARDQLREATQMVKDTQAMLSQSRREVVQGARAALSEAKAARKAADALALEATAQLKKLQPGGQAEEDVAALQVAHPAAHLATPHQKVAAPKLVALQVPHKAARTLPWTRARAMGPQPAAKPHLIRLTQVKDVDDSDSDSEDSDEDDASM